MFIRQLLAQIDVHPKPELLLQTSDTVIVMGHRGDIPQFAKNYVLKRDLKYRGSPRL